MYDIILQKDMNPQELQTIQASMSPRCTIIAFDDGTGHYPGSITPFKSNDQLMEILTKSQNRYLLIFQRAATLCPPWESPLFQQFDSIHSPDIIGVLTTHNGAKLSALINHLKADTHPPPQEMTLTNLTTYIQQTNSGESVRVPVVDSPIYATKRETFMANHVLWGNYSHSNFLCKVIAQDVLAQET
ncbi:MAG: hypothetical protein OCD01_07300 [Fibrobacterales bacterium]